MREIIVTGTATGVVLARTPGALPHSADITALEQAWGYALPPDYRDFLLRFGGGVCDGGSMVPIIEEPLDLFYCPSCCEAWCPPLRAPAVWQAEWPGLPARMLPVGKLAGGCAVVLVYAGGRCEAAAVSREGDSIRMWMAAASFTDFLLRTTRDGGILMKDSDL